MQRVVDNLLFCVQLARILQPWRRITRRSVPSRPKARMVSYDILAPSSRVTSACTNRQTFACGARIKSTELQTMRYGGLLVFGYNICIVLICC